MKRTYVLVDGEFVERKRDSKGRYHYVMPDIQPYRSMIDGKMVSSRSEHTTTTPPSTLPSQRWMKAALSV